MRGAKASGSRAAHGSLHTVVLSASYFGTSGSHQDAAASLRRRCIWVFCLADRSPDGWNLWKSEQWSASRSIRKAIQRAGETRKADTFKDCVLGRFTSTSPA